MAITITGDKVIQAKLRALESRLRRKILVEALGKAIGPMHRRAVEEAPVDTGTLRHAIDLEVKGASSGKASAQVVVRSSEAKHAVPVELGAPRRHREPDAFLVRALDAEGKPTLQRAAKLVAEGIERAV